MDSIAGIKGLELFSIFFIKSTLLLTFSLILVFLCRKKSASLRHFILSVSLICLLLLPVLSSFTKGWETGMLPSWPNENRLSQISQRATALDKTNIPLNTQTPALSPQPQPEPDMGKQKTSIFFLPQYVITQGFFGSVLVFIWSAGLLILLSRIFLGLIGIHNLTRQGEEISGSSWRELLNHFLKKISIKRKIHLFSHIKVNVPLTWGVIKPVVILPSDSRNWTQEQRSSALFHELSHIKRSDFLVKILARCSLALYWFNPLSWFAFRMMKKEQEKACDELVLKTGVKPSTYAVNLLSIKKAGQLAWSPPSTALGAVGRSQLNERLTAILKHELKPKEVNMKTKIMLSSLVIAVIAFIGLARPSQSAAFTDILLPQDETFQEKQATKTGEEAQKDAKKKDKKITWVSEDGKEITFIISVDEEGKTNIAKVDGDMVIDIHKGIDEKTFTLHLDDKNLVLQKDDEGNWTLKAAKDGARHKLSYNISTAGGEKEAVHVTAPVLHVTSDIAIPKRAIDIHIEEAEGVAKTVKVAPNVIVHKIPQLAYSIHKSDVDQKELNKKLEEITEKLKAIREKSAQEESKEAQEEALKEVEEMLEALSEDLNEKKVELKDIALSFHSVDAETIEDIKWTQAKDIKIDIDMGKTVAFVGTDEGGFHMTIKAHFDSTSRSEYEEIVKKLKEELPEGYTVESSIDEENELFTIHVKGDKEDKESESRIKEIFENLKDRLSKIKKI